MTKRFPTRTWHPEASQAQPIVTLPAAELAAFRATIPAPTID